MSILEQLLQQFPQLNFKSNHALAPQTYFKIGGPAEVYVELTTSQQIAEVVKFCQLQKIKLTVIGGSSNVIVDDNGVSGLVIQLKNDEFINLHQVIDQDKHLIKAGAGLKTALLVKNSIDEGLTGLEFFLGVPGTVGGAVYNNAHYLEDLISDHIYQVEIVTPAGEIKTLSKDECEFGYDLSRFHHSQEIILAAIFALKTGKVEESRELIKKATIYRAQTQPLGLPSSGCIFRNTPNTDHLKKLFPQFKEREFVPAGFIIDQAGLKGASVGGVEVSSKHAAFFINHGTGTAADLKKLIALVKKTVNNKYQVKLQEEVFYLS